MLIEDGSGGFGVWLYRGSQFAWGPCVFGSTTPRSLPTSFTALLVLYICLILDCCSSAEPKTTHPSCAPGNRPSKAASFGAQYSCAIGGI